MSCLCKATGFCGAINNEVQPPESRFPTVAGLPSRGVQGAARCGGVRAWMGWGWWLHPRAEASSAAPPRGSPGAARDGRFSAKRRRGQPQSLRAGIRPRIEREERTHVGSSEHGGKQREPGGKLAGSSPSLWPAQRKLLPRPCLLLPSAWHSVPARAAGTLRKTPAPTYQRWQRKEPLWSEVRTATKRGQHTGIPGGWQAVAVLREGVSVEALHPRDAPSTWHREQLAGDWQAQRGEAGECPLGSL